jgi:hypothetical protein
MLRHCLTTVGIMNEASAPSLGKAGGAGTKSKRKRSSKYKENKRLRAAAHRALRGQDIIDRQEKHSDKPALELKDANAKIKAQD